MSNSWSLVRPFEMYPQARGFDTLPSLPPMASFREFGMFFESFQPGAVTGVKRRCQRL